MTLAFPAPLLEVEGRERDAEMGGEGSSLLTQFCSSSVDTEGLVTCEKVEIRDRGRDLLISLGATYCPREP